MSTNVKVAVIGGGIVGCSVLAALAKLGWTDTLLIEKRDLTSGSTWHAAGNTTHFGPHAEMVRLFVDSIACYLDAEEETGQNVGFHKAGSLRLATTEAELAFFNSLTEQYKALDIAYKVVSNEEIKTLHPLLNTEAIYGAASTPDDGHVDAYGSTIALAKQATCRGAEIWRQSPVEKIESENGKWRLHTAKGEVVAEHVVIATSFWSREMLEPLGIHVPIYALQHHEIITAPVPEIEALDFELPAIRDSAVSCNVRQEGKGFLCGIYESNPEFWAVDGIPKDFAEELLPPNTERLEPFLLELIEKLPAFGEAGIMKANNGPICYTPDGCPLLGPVEGHDGLWLATGFNVGIGTGGGSGKYLANWITTGKEPYDLSIVHPNRFPNTVNRDEALASISKVYATAYQLH